MKKFRFFSIFFINLFLILLFFILSDFIVYSIYKASNDNLFRPTPYFFTRFIKQPIYFIYLKNYFDGNDNYYSGRLPVGTKYKSTPILLFGDSYAFGFSLPPNKTFAYLLSEKLHRPVYNRAIPGSTFSHMFYQVDSDSTTDFFSQVPKCDTVIYILESFHFNRLYSYSNLDVINRFVNLMYTIKNEKLFIKDYNNYIFNFFVNSYTLRYINDKYIEYFLQQSSNMNKVYSDSLVYFIQTKELLEKRWGNNVNFVILVYDSVNILEFDLLSKKFEEKGFKVIDLSKLVGDDLTLPKYTFVDNSHPSDYAWKIITPAVVEEIFEKK